MMAARRWRLCAALMVCAWHTGAAAQAPAPLIAAVKAGDDDAALTLVAARQGIDAAEADGTTALHWAAWAGDRALVQALLDAGASATATNRYGMTALHLAAVNGDAEMLRALLAAGADPNLPLPEGETALMTAARTGVPAAVEALLDHGADIAAREEWFGENALIWAATENHAETVRVLAMRGADVNARSALQPRERRRLGQSVLPLGHWTPLMYAARQNALDAGHALIEAGADLDLVDPDGATALVIAIINAHYEFAALLLEAGADPNIVEETGMGPLYAAIDMHRLAVGHGRPNPKPVGRLGAVDIAGMLLAHGADPNAQLNGPIMQRQHTAGDSALGAGATPFLRAAKSGDIAMMRLLLDAGVDPTATMPNGSTALMYAAGLGWRYGSPLAPSYDQGSDAEALEALQLLLELGLEINAQNDDGNTALHGALSGRNAEPIIRFLLEAGADPRIKNGRGQTVIAMAEARASEDIIALLQDAAAR